MSQSNQQKEDENEPWVQNVGNVNKKE